MRSLLSILTLSATILLTMLPASAPGTPPPDDEGFDLTLWSINCTSNAFYSQGFRDERCEPAFGVVFSVEDAAGQRFGACTADDLTPSGYAFCELTDLPYDTTYVITQDPTTVPLGARPSEDNPVTLDVEGPDTASYAYAFFFINVYEEGVGLTTGNPALTPAASAGNDIASNAQPTAAETETLTAKTDGSNAAIYAGDCEADFTGEPVATLTNVRPPDGENQGADDASAVETSFTTLDLPLDDILADDHVLVVFDEDDDTLALACGPIGGILTEDGTLAFGLPAIDASRYSGVAYLSEAGDRTLATIFLAEDLSIDTTPTA